MSLTDSWKLAAQERKEYESSILAARATQSDYESQLEQLKNELNGHKTQIAKEIAARVSADEHLKGLSGDLDERTSALDAERAARITLEKDLEDIRKELAIKTSWMTEVAADRFTTNEELKKLRENLGERASALDAERAARIASDQNVEALKKELASRMVEEAAGKGKELKKLREDLDERTSPLDAEESARIASDKRLEALEQHLNAHSFPLAREVTGCTSTKDQPNGLQIDLDKRPSALNVEQSTPHGDEISFEESIRSLSFAFSLERRQTEESRLQFLKVVERFEAFKPMVQELEGNENQLKHRLKEQQERVDVAINLMKDVMFGLKRKSYRKRRLIALKNGLATDSYGSNRDVDGDKVLHQVEIDDLGKNHPIAFLNAFLDCQGGRDPFGSKAVTAGSQVDDPQNISPIPCCEAAADAHARILWFESMAKTTEGKIGNIATELTYVVEENLGSPMAKDVQQLAKEIMEVQRASIVSRRKPLAELPVCSSSRAETAEYQKRDADDESTLKRPSREGGTEQVVRGYKRRRLEYDVPDSL